MLSIYLFLLVWDWMLHKEFSSSVYKFLQHNHQDCLDIISLQQPSSGVIGHGSSGGKGNGSKFCPLHGGQNPNVGKLTTKSSKFTGACEALKDHIFDFSDHHQADGY